MTCILDAFTSKSPLAPHKTDMFLCAADAHIKTLSGSAEDFLNVILSSLLGWL